jgi:RNA recognition motif-containing protein
VFVGNLSFEVTRDELIQAFGAAGKVVDAKVPTDRETGRPRGFAFVEFEDEETAQKSIALLNGKSLKGRPLRVNEAENRPPRPAGAGSGAPYRPSFRSGGGEAPPPPSSDFSEFGRKGERRARGAGGGRSQKHKGPRKSEQPPRRTERKRNRGIDDEDY